MSAGRNTVTLYSTVTGGTLLIGLILFAPWPLWASLILVVALATALILLAKAIGSRSGTSPRPEPTFTFTGGPSTDLRRTRVSDVLLPTDLQDYSFLFSATV